MRSRWALALAAVVGLTSIAQADETSAIPQESQVDEAEAGAPAPLLTGVLDRSGIGKFFEAGGVKLGGYVQGSWTYNTSSPHTREITGRSFDFENQDLTLNGIMLTAERSVEESEDLDFGFRVDLLYGADARFTKSNGMFDNRGFVFNAAEDGDVGPNEQFDIPQAFIQLALPVGNGLIVTAGKFITPIGFEYVDPTKNALYSHGFLFTFAGPYSQAGITARYALNENLSLLAGVSRGWDQSLDDNNSAIDFLGQVDLKISEQWQTTLTLSTGPQQDDNDGRFRTLLDLLVYYIPNETVSFGLEAVYGIEASVPGTTEDYAQFYGLAFYPSYKLSDAWALNGRLEWFSDLDATRGVGSENVYSATVGVTWAPFAAHDRIGGALRIRPEIRFDYADDAVFDGDDTQTTFAVDAVLAF